MRNGVECVLHNSIGLQFVQHVVKVITLLFYDVLFLPKKIMWGGDEGWQKPLNWEIQPNILQQIEDLLSCLVSSQYLHKTFV